MCGLLPQAGRLSQTRLIEHLARHGYNQCPDTPYLFRYRTRDIMFNLVVHNFGVRYESQSDIDHLEKTLRLNEYKIIIRSDGDQYLGMNIAFNTARIAVTIFMPGYIHKMLTRFRPQFLDKAHRPAQTPGRPLYCSRVRAEVTPAHIDQRLPRLPAESITKLQNLLRLRYDPHLLRRCLIYHDP
jgi:hypothetical protein